MNIKSMICQLVLALAGGVVSASALASNELMASLDSDLTDLSLDQLLDMEITSVSKSAEKLTEAAAAVHVITSQDIARSPFRSIPELLRMVPGIHVARIGTSSYAITARGFNSSTSDKLEVLLDGRSVYTPLFSGVFWDTLDTMIDDIDRIEVIRGPGGTLWGANAVNGVINIVTKNTSETQGGVFYTRAGNERASSGVRTGGTLADVGHFRAYAKTTDRDDSAQADGSDIRDRQDITTGGFRADFQSEKSGSLTIQGDVHESVSASGTPAAPTETEASGHNLLARWSKSWSDGQSATIQGYFDYYERLIPGTFGEKRETYDVSAQYGMVPTSWLDLLVGAGYRNSEDETNGPPSVIIFLPASRRLETTNVFAQGKIELAEGVTLTVGTKYEENDFTGSEWQPGLRFAWVLNEKHTVWGAASRAVRTPNRFDHDLGLFLPVPLGGFPAGFSRIGNRDFDSEKVNAYELGYRTSVAEQLVLDFAVFYNDYDDLRTTEVGNQFENNAEATSIGGELSARWIPSERWQLHSGISYLDLDIEPKANSSSNDDAEDNDPALQGFIRGLIDLPAEMQIDGMLRYVDELRNQNVDQYWELDLRYAWQATDYLQLSLIGRNLLEDQHAEFGGGGEFERSVEFGVTLDF